MSINTQAWLEDLAVSCKSTLGVLNRKAERAKSMSDSDQAMSDICMGYLYLIHTANSEGLLDRMPELTITTIERTVH